MSGSAQYGKNAFLKITSSTNHTYGFRLLITAQSSQCRHRARQTHCDTNTLVPAEWQRSGICRGDVALASEDGFPSRAAGDRRLSVGWLRVSSIWQPAGRVGLGVLANEHGRERWWWCVRVWQLSQRSHYETPSWLIIAITDHIVHTRGCSVLGWQPLIFSVQTLIEMRGLLLPPPPRYPTPARSSDTCGKTACLLVWWQWPPRLACLFSGSFQEVSFWQADTLLRLVGKNNSNQSFIEIVPFTTQEQWTNWSLSCSAM